MNTHAFEEAYAKLNGEQKRAVDTVEGPVMVVAGPGTGKTQILTLRIANIIATTDTKPENILALTFTNSGVYAMRKRLNELIGDTAYRVNIFTFHAFCEHLIKEFSFYFPSFEYAQVIDDLEKVTIIEGILDRSNVVLLKSTHDDYMHINTICRAVDSIKKEGYSPDKFKKIIPIWKDALLANEDIYYKRKYRQFNVGDIKQSEKLKIDTQIQKAEEVALIFEEYQKEISKRRRYDFSDMILSVLQELRSNQDFKFDVQEKYQYILIDEHQDTNAGQNELIELLTDAEHLGGRPNIFTVGDEKQSIYRFQGASEETFAHFHALYKDIENITLKENYRSTQNILSGAHGVITHTLPESQLLHANSKENILIQVGGFSNYKLELMYVAEDIKRKIAVGVLPEHIAIIFRSNKHTQDIKSVLAHAGIPFSIHSKDSIFNDNDITNIVTLLRVIHNPLDEESLAKSLFINFLGLDAYDTVKILQQRRVFEKQNKKLIDVLGDIDVLTSAGVTHPESFVAYTHIIKDAITLVHSARFLDFLKDFLMNIGYTPYILRSPLSQDKLRKLDKFFDEIKKQSAAKNTKHTPYSLSDCISMIDAFHKYGIDIENNNPELEAGVQLMTAHGSKGKEFEYVYMVNTTRSNWEKSRGFGGISLPVQSYVGGEHDERRLFYVAMTRAKRGLVITYSITDWQGKEQEKSQFITEIPNDFVEVVESSGLETTYMKDLQIFVMPHVERTTIFDVDFIQTLYTERGLNLTALNNYVECPLKYFYRSLIQIPSAYSPFLSYGNAIHATLEKFFKLSKKKEQILGREDLISLFEKEIDAVDMIHKDFVKYSKKGIEALGAYYDQYASKWNTRVLIEQFVARDFVLNSGESIKLTGKIDKIEFLGSELEGPIAVIDYKTGRSYSEKDKAGKESLTRQIIFYYVLLEEFRSGVHRIEYATLDFIEKNKKEQYEQYSVPVSENHIFEVKELINTVSGDIMSGDFLNKGCGKRDCEWCALHARIHAE